MSAYLITGESGVGKSATIDELSRRGYHAYGTEDMPGIMHHFDTHTGKVLPSAPPAPIDFSRYHYNWDIPALKRLLDQPGPVFIAAYASNSFENYHLFAHVFALYVTPKTARHRILSRPDSINDFGKHPDELADILKGHAVSKEFWRSKGASLIDAEQPVVGVADEILRQLKLPTAAT